MEFSSDPLYSPGNLTDFLNINKNPPQQEIEKVSKTGKNGVVETTLYLFIILLSVGINLKVLCALSSLSRRKRRRATTILIGHMSTIAILFTFYVLLSVAEGADVVHIWGKATCKVLTFLKNTIFGVFTLNITAIIYERFRSFSYNSGSLLLCRLLLLIWFTSLVVSVPSIFTTVYVEPLQKSGNDTFTNREGKSVEKGVCKSIPFLGLVGATIVYELLRFILFHLFVVCYMAYALLKIRSKLAHLYILKPIPNERMRRKVQSIRFIYIHFISFILIWLPLGTLVFVHRIIKKTSKPQQQQLSPSSSPPTTINRLMTALFFIYMVLNPLIYLLLIIDHPTWSFYCWHGGESRKTAEVAGGVNQREEKDCRRHQNFSAVSDSENTFEMSRIHPNGKNGLQVVVTIPSPALETSRVSTFAVTSDDAHVSG